jgi:hypothetical protein
VQCADELVEVLEGAELGVDGLVVADVVSVVALWRGEDRGQPDRVDAQVVEVVEVADEPAQVPDPVAVCRR